MMEERKTMNFAIEKLTAKLVSAYFARNHVPSAEIAKVMTDVHSALALLATSRTPVDSDADLDKPSPAQIRKSIREEGLISFIDGRPYQTLKRHLKKHRLDPKSYRERYGLPADYPMVSPGYSKTRSSLAKVHRLGRKEAPQPAAPVTPKRSKGRSAAEPVGR
jgi:predicted transcriptional regulator